VQKQQNKLMKNTWKISLILVLGLFIFNCRGPLRLNEFDLAEGYQVNGLQYELNSSFFSLNDSITELSVVIKPSDLLFAKTKTDNYIARYTIGYKVFEGYNEKLPIDTARIHYSLKQENVQNQKLHKIKMFAPLGKNYIVKIFITDENRNFTASTIKTLRKKNTNDRSYFKIQSLNSIKINPTTFQEDSFKLICSNPSIKKLKVKIFSSNLISAPKPYEVNYSYQFAQIPDSTFDIKITSNLTFPHLKNGYYHFITDTISNTGFSVFSVNESHPKLNSLNQAIGAMGYLLGKSEYAELIRSETPKKSFEQEWLRLAGNRQRARNLIKDYYREVTIANKLFTCHQPGWTTDRGMIYIIYGPPRIVYRYDNSEVWIYGEENNLLSEQFDFKKIETNISDNIFVLKRNINFKINYNRMVNAWIDERGY